MGHVAPESNLVQLLQVIHDYCPWCPEREMLIMEATDKLLHEEPGAPLRPAHLASLLECCCKIWQATEGPPRGRLPCPPGYATAAVSTN